MTDNDMTDIADLEVTWRRGQSYVVWSENDNQRAYVVDLSGDHPSCTCEHGEHEGNGTTAACRHICKVVTVGDARPDLDREAFQAVVEAFDSLRETRGEFRDMVDQWKTLRESEQAVTDDGQTSEGSGSSTEQNGSQGDVSPVNKVTDWLADQGVNMGGVKVYEHAEYGSIQIETNGNLSDDEFDTYRSVMDHDGIRWDANNGLNYIPADMIDEVVG